MLLKWIDMVVNWQTCLSNTGSLSPWGADLMWDAERMPYRSAHLWFICTSVSKPNNTTTTPYAFSSKGEARLLECLATWKSWACVKVYSLSIYKEWRGMWFFPTPSHISCNHASVIYLSPNHNAGVSTQWVDEYFFSLYRHWTLDHV